MIVENRTISEIYPLAWKEFENWSLQRGNEKVMKLVLSSFDFRPLIGYYFDFFIRYAKYNQDIKRTIAGYSPIEPVKIRKETIRKLFMKLEAHIRSVENWTYGG